MSASSPVFFALLLPIYIFEAWLLSHGLKFHRELAANDQERFRLTQLDGLRGLLALSVVFIHALEYHDYLVVKKWSSPPSNFYLQLGVFPVTMFFFLSGYVFWRKLVKRSQLSTGAFLKNRLSRLGPVYGVACAWLFILMAFESHFKENVSFLKLVLEGASWLSCLGSGHDINRIASSKIWLGPSWTLRYEWFFYLSLPAFVWFARRRARLLLLLVPAAALAWLLAQWHEKGLAASLIHAARGYAQFLAYAWGAGMVLAVVELSAKLKLFAQSNVATLTSLSAIAVTLFFIKPKYGPVESLMLFLPFACICFGNTWFGLLTSRPVLFLGRTSYSLYLLHLLTLRAVGLLVGGPIDLTHLGAWGYWSFACVCGTFALVISAYSYQYLEHPFLHAGKKKRAYVVPKASSPMELPVASFLPADRWTSDATVPGNHHRTSPDARRSSRVQSASDMSEAL